MRARPAVVCCGIDPGSRATGFCALRVSGPAVELLELGEIRLGRGEDLGERLVRLGGELEERFARVRPRWVAIESGVAQLAGPARWGGGRVLSAMALAEARGVARATAARRPSCRVVEVGPSEWRSALGIAGGVRREVAKDATRRLVALRLRVDLPGENAADAAGIALWLAGRVGAPSFWASGASGLGTSQERRKPVGLAPESS